MELYLNELSLHGQYFGIPDFEKAVRKILEINKLATSKNISFETNHPILIQQKAIRESILVSSLGKITDTVLKKQFHSFLFKNVQNWDLPERRLHQENDIYECPILEENVTNSTLAQVAERNLQNSDIQRIVINFIDSKFQPKTDKKEDKKPQIEIIKNETENVFLDCLEDKADLKEWFEKEVQLDKLLRDETRFRKTNKPFVKSGRSTPIYQEIATGYYWYPDYFHRDNKFHFEVFDTNKKHLGEADLEGNLDTSKKDSTKQIS